jgi:hypothetical protein
MRTEVQIRNELAAAQKQLGVLADARNGYISPALKFAQQTALDKKIRSLKGELASLVKAAPPPVAPAPPASNPSPGPASTALGTIVPPPVVPPAAAPPEANYVVVSYPVLIRYGTATARRFNAGDRVPKGYTDVIYLSGPKSEAHNAQYHISYTYLDDTGQHTVEVPAGGRLPQGFDISRTVIKDPPPAAGGAIGNPPTTAPAPSPGESSFLTSVLSAIGVSSTPAAAPAPAAAGLVGTTTPAPSSSALPAATQPSNITPAPASNSPFAFVQAFAGHNPLMLAGVGLAGVAAVLFLWPKHRKGGR